MNLKFNKDGKFKILLLADTQDTDTPQKETIEIIENMLEKTNPDLVVFLGDNIAGYWKGVDENKTEKAIDKIIAPIQEKDVPFALVFGNHDHEGLCDKHNKMSEKEAKAFQLKIFQKYKNCLAVCGDGMTGYCNYNLTIEASNEKKKVFNLWFMDSNPYAKEGGYGYVQADQTQWYINKSDELKNENNGKPLPSVLFQHIPVPEVYNLTDEVKLPQKGSVRGQSALFTKFYKANGKVTQGGFLEGPCCADVRHNQFETWKRQGDIIGAFFGHDHPNDYFGEVDGIKLCAVLAAGYYSYGQNHGARTLELDEKDLTDFKTELFHSDEILGYKVKPRYKAKHGYFEYKNKFIPYICCALATASLLGISALTIKSLLKK